MKRNLNTNARSEYLMPPKPELKPFDLEIGDKVVYKARTDKRDNTRIGMFDDPTYNIWRVTDISEHVFVCKNRYGIRTAFRKDEYRIGEIVRYD